MQLNKYGTDSRGKSLSNSYYNCKSSPFYKLYIDLFPVNTGSRSRSKKLRELKKNGEGNNGSQISSH